MGGWVVSKGRVKAHLREPVGASEDPEPNCVGGAPPEPPWGRGAPERSTGVSPLGLFLDGTSC